MCRDTLLADPTAIRLEKVRSGQKLSELSVPLLAATPLPYPLDTRSEFSLILLYCDCQKTEVS